MKMLQSYISAKICLPCPAAGRRLEYAAAGGARVIQYRVRPKAGVVRPRAESRPTLPEAVWGDNAAAGGGEGRSNIRPGRRPEY